VWLKWIGLSYRQEDGDSNHSLRDIGSSTRQSRKSRALVGARKAQILKDVLERPLEPEVRPAQLIRPSGGSAG
jgi:hypothetical protein